MGILMDYQDFLKSKKIGYQKAGLPEIPDLNPALFDFQRDIVSWSLRLGKACIFAGCGLGKTLMQLEWAKHVQTYTNGKILIAAPLAVSQQTIREGHKFGIEVVYSRDGKAKAPITITNYEMLGHFDMADFSGVVADESSCLKDYTSKIRNFLIENMAVCPYRLACTATPAPNDLMELGNHAEFMGAMKRSEMLSMFFVHDGGETQKWRLKGHARDDFWRWLSSWAVMIRMPSDLGYDDGGFQLPPLKYHHHVIECGKPQDGMLFVDSANTLRERQQARKASADERCEAAAELINSDSDQWLIWCDRNDESVALSKLIENGVEVKGSDSIKHKEESMLGFSDGSVHRLITKPSICGWGMNWQNCHKIAFVGLSDSFEQFYQAVRRVWRFGQTRPVQCHIFTSDAEGAVVQNIKRKENQAEEMQNGMIEHMRIYESDNIRGHHRTITNYLPQDKMEMPSWM